jgi:adenine-specific DNA-methyltransferase
MSILPDPVTIARAKPLRRSAMKPEVLPPQTDDIAAIHAYCAVYTLPIVAAAMLDHLGWTSGADLSRRRLLEPSCGDGAFLLPAVDRLLDSAERRGFLTETGLADRLVAFEFDVATASSLAERVTAVLIGRGLAPDIARRLTDRWVRSEDFLLAKDLPRVTDIVGNPPYMRWSKLPPRLRAAYESALPAHAAKGDLCLAFVCRGAEVLDEASGRMALLCADRWLRCAYGSGARAWLMGSLRIALHVEAHGLPVFAGEREVSTSAAVTVFDTNSEGGSLLRRPETVDALIADLSSAASDAGATSAPLLRGKGGALLGEEQLQSLIVELGERLPTIETAGVSVRCGMALGVAKAFMVTEADGVEADRLVPLVRSQDILNDGTARSLGFLVNPWSADGSLVSLSDFPKLAAHLQPWRERLAARTCVSKPENWYRTIDRLPTDRDDQRVFLAGMSRKARAARAKPDQQPTNAVYILRASVGSTAALFGAVNAGLLDLFAAALSPTFAGGSKRFDGNMLRQVCLPRWDTVDADIVEELSSVEAGEEPRPDLVCRLLGIEDLQGRTVVRRTLEQVWAQARAR